MAEPERTFVEYLVYVSENYSPLDFMLIADHIDKFFMARCSRFKSQSFPC